MRKRIILPFLGLLHILYTSNLSAQDENYELRGVWLTNVASTLMNSKQQIAEAMDSLSSWGINAIFPVMLNDGYTLYPSLEMQRVTGIAVHPAFEGRDILAEMIAEAHRLGIEIHVWFEYGFCASFAANGGPILQANPGWAGKRFQKESAEDDNNFFWMSQANPEVQQFLINLGIELAENYDLDGIQLDRIRYGTKKGNDGWPVASDFGYDEAHLQRYRDEHAGSEMPDTWTPTNSDFKKWRSQILDQFHSEFYQQIKQVNPNLKISNTPVVYPYGYDNFMQNWPNWPKQVSVDLISPQLYRYDLPSYRLELEKVLNNQLPKDYAHFYPGMLIRDGSYQATAQLTKSFVQENRSHNVKGGLFWFYEGLPALGQALREDIFSIPARVPFRDKIWRPQASIIEENALPNVPTGNWTLVTGKGDASYYAFNDTILTALGGSGAKIRYEADIIAEGFYDIYTHQPYGLNLSPKVPLSLFDGSGVIQYLDETDNYNRGWIYIYTLPLEKGQQSVLEISTAGVTSSQTVAADAVMLILNRQLSPDAVVSINEEKKWISADKINLKPNYPNPFNASTTISFQLQTSGEVDLSIYNLLGQKIITLFSGKKPAGYYTLTWNSESQGTGVYLLRLTSGKFIQSRKLILIR